MPGKHTLGRKSTAFFNTDEYVDPEKKLGLLAFVIFGFFCTAGGAFGNEVLIAVSPPAYVIGCLTLGPLLYGLPIALISTELATVWPEAGGQVVFVEKALGPIVAMQDAYWVFVNNAVDAAVYPIICADYLTNFGVDVNEFYIELAIILSMSVFHYCGLDYVVKFNLIIFIFTSVVTFVYIGLCFQDPKPYNWIETGKESEVDFPSLLSWTLWMSSGMSSLCVFAIRVKNVKKIFIPGVMILIVFNLMITVGPILSALNINSDWKNYEDGDFMIQGKHIVGGGYAFFCAMGVAAVIDNTALYNSQALVAQETISYIGEYFFEDELDNAQSCIMQHLIQSPSEISVRRIYVVICGSLSIIMCYFFEYNFLIQVETILYVFTKFLFFLSFFKLRRSEEYQVKLNALGEDAFILPGGKCGFYCIMIGPISVLIGYTISMLFFSGNLTLLWELTGIIVLIGILGHCIILYFKPSKKPKVFSFSSHITTLSNNETTNYGHVKYKESREGLI